MAGRGNVSYFPREITETALAHVIGDKAEQAYRRSDAREKRRKLMDAWSAYCEPKTSANISPQCGGRVGGDGWLWRVREVEVARGERLINEAGELRARLLKCDNEAGEVGQAGGMEMVEFGFILGALIAVLCSVFFYLRAGEDLRCEAEKLRNKAEDLRKLHELTLFALTNPQAKLELKRDEAGNVIGLIVQLSGSTTIRSSAKAEVTLTEKTD